MKELIWIGLTVSCCVLWSSCNFEGESYLTQGKEGPRQEFREVVIGEQHWMAHNLDVEVFRNGDLIDQAITPEEWRLAGEQKRPAWCFFDNDSINGKLCGKLYNWYAVSDPRGLAPEGWKIPSDEDWSVLINALNGDKCAGEILKCASHWLESDGQSGNGNDSVGFCALPGGSRYPDGTFSYWGKMGSWWTSSETNSYNAWMRAIKHYYGDVIRYDTAREKGLSVRCLK